MQDQDNNQSHYDRKLRRAWEVVKPREMILGAILALLLLWLLQL